MSINSDFDNLFDNIQRSTTKMSRDNTSSLDTDSDGIYKNRLSQQIIFQLTHILKDYVFVDTTASKTPFYFVSTRNNWSEYSYSNSYTEFLKQKSDLENMYSRLDTISKKINSNASQSSIDSDLSIAILKYWSQSFAFGTYANTDGTYQLVSHEPQSIKIYSKEKSKPYIQSQPKDSIIALTPYD